MIISYLFKWKAALASRHLIWTSLFTLNFTIVSQGWLTLHSNVWLLWNRHIQRANYLLNNFKIRIIFLYIRSYLPFLVLFIPLCRFKSASVIISMFPKVSFNIPSNADQLVEIFLERTFIWNLVLPLEGYLCCGPRVLASRGHCASLKFQMRLEAGTLLQSSNLSAKLEPWSWL